MLAKGINVIMENKYVYFISHEGIEFSTEKGFQWSVWPKSPGPEGCMLVRVNQAVPVVVFFSVVWRMLHCPSHCGIKREKRWEFTLTTAQWYVNECVLMDYSKIQTEWPRTSMVA